MINGKDVLILWNGSVIGAVTNVKISNGCDTIETASPSSAEFKTFIAGRKEWSVSADWLVNYITDYKKLIRVGNTYTLKFGYNGTQSAYFVTGSAICTRCDIEGHVGNIARGTFQFKGTGSLT